MDAKSGAGRSILTTLLTFALATIALAAGASMHEATPTPSAVSEAAEHPDPHVQGVANPQAHGADPAHGGAVERVHDVSGCTLVDASAPQGNWTHGDYVRLVAKNGSHEDVRAAARSDCGKPLVATEHGNAGAAPPGQAKPRREAGGSNRGGGPPSQAGSPASAWNSGHIPGGS
jgi:hypothetical protein